MSDFPTYIIVQRAGRVPERKGGFSDGKLVEKMLRELYEIDPASVCIVISMPETCWPTLGREWIAMYGDRRRKPLPPANDGVDTASTTSSTAR
jgi:hypothetical protein